MCLFALGNVDSPVARRADRWLPWAFYASAGMAFLLKGPVSILFILGGCLVFAGTEWLSQRRQVRQHLADRSSVTAGQILRFLTNPAGLCIYLICLGAWPVASYLAYPQIVDDWKQELFGYARGDFGTSPVLYYFYMVPFELLPWTFLVAAGAVYGWQRGWARSPLARFLLCWCLTGVAILSCSKFKSSHYAYPLLPPCTVVAACGLGIWLKQQHGWPQRLRCAWALGLAGLLTICCCAAMMVLRQGHSLDRIPGVLSPKLYLALQSLPHLPWTVHAVIATLGVGLIVTLYMEYRRWAVAQMIVLFATAWLVIAGAERYILPFEDGYGIRAEFARRASTKVPAGAKLYLVGLGENQVVWYLSPPLVRLGEPPQLPPPAATGGPGTAALYLVGPPPSIEALQSLGTVEVLERLGPTSGWAKQDDLALVRLKR
jgi:hypothetical protein